ncbi:hypothetical protein [Nocardioides sp.]|uniref:hypothetical protein n=1 Tax=Nocardioides sp. TaxID=35761 RepID=UPI003563C7A9
MLVSRITDLSTRLQATLSGAVAVARPVVVGVFGQIASRMPNRDRAERPHTTTFAPTVVRNPDAAPSTKRATSTPSKPKPAGPTPASVAPNVASARPRAKQPPARPKPTSVPGAKLPVSRAKP